MDDDSPLSRRSARPIWPLTIGVVDDDDASCRLLVRELRAQGHRCSIAANGRDALQFLSHDRADIILSDWEMPGIGGAELCRCTRAADGDGAYTYFISMTGHSDTGHLLAAMEAGADDHLAKPIDLAVLDARLVLASRVIALHREHRARTRELRRTSERNLAASRTDALTQLGSRRALNEELDAVVSRFHRYGRPACVAVCDIDFFKRYNDAHGHLAGDKVLADTSQAMKRSVRASDRVFRYGGEEFVVILPEQHLGEARQILERVRADIESHGKVTVSIGVAELIPADENSEDAVARADRALYRAKAAGRNRVEV